MFKLYGRVAAELYFRVEYCCVWVFALQLGLVTHKAGAQRIP